MPKITVLAQKMRPCTPPPSTVMLKRTIPFVDVGKEEKRKRKEKREEKRKREK